MKILPKYFFQSLENLSSDNFFELRNIFHLTKVLCFQREGLHLQSTVNFCHFPLTVSYFSSMLINLIGEKIEQKTETS